MPQIKIRVDALARVFLKIETVI